MRKIALLLLASTAICSVGQAQIPNLNTSGVPYTTTYKPNASQTLDIIQDQRGIMYFANDDGVFEYDGINMTLTPMLYALSLAVDNNNVVRVGSSESFGYLYPNENGVLEYVSMTSQVPDSVPVDPIYKT